MKKFYSIIAAVVLSATVMSGNAWAAVATYSWTIADYVDDVDNGINIGMGSEQSVNADMLDLTGETALELLYASGANKTCTFGCRPTAYSYDGFSYRYFVKLKNGDGTLIIPHISGSGKLTLVVGENEGTFTVTTRGRNVNAEITTSSLSQSATSQNSVQEVSWDLSGLVYEDIEIKALFNAEVYSVTWEPNSYFWDWTRFGVENSLTNTSGVDYFGNQGGNKYVFFTEKDGYIQIGTSCGKRIFFKSLLTTNNTRIYKQGYGKYPFCTYATESDNCSFLTDPVSCVGGVLRVYYRNNSDSKLLRLVVSVNENEVFSKDFEKGRDTYEFLFNQSFDREQLKISLSGSVCNVYYIEFIPSNTVTDRVEVASDSRIAQGKTTVKTTYKYKRNGTEYSGSTSETETSGVLAGFVGMISGTGNVSATAGSVSITQDAGSNLKYIAAGRQATVTKTVAGVIPTSGYVPYNGSYYSVYTRDGNSYFKTNNNREYQITEASVETTYNDPSKFNFYKWTTDDEGLYDYVANPLSESGMKKSDGTTLYAHFMSTAVSGTLAKDVVCTCTATVDAGGGGTAAVSTSQILKGKSTYFIATPDASHGYWFDCWLDSDGDPVSSQNPYTYTFSGSVNSTYTLKARFKRDELTCTADYVTANNSEAFGSVHLNNNQDVTTANAHLYETVQFQATPHGNAQFVGWFSDAEGKNMVNASATYNYLVQEDKTLYAKFVEASDETAATLTVSVLGHGSVVSNNPALDPAGSPISTYLGQTAIFTATPDPGYRLDYWTVNGAPIYNPSRSYTLTIDRKDASIVANFARDSRSALTWWGERRDWIIGEQTHSVNIGKFTFDASSTVPATVETSTRIVYNDREYTIPYHFTAATKGTHGYIKVAANGPGLLTIVARNTTDEAQTLKIYENTSKYNGAVASSTPAVELEVPVSAGSEYSELTCNLTTNTGDFVITTTGALDIYYIKFRGQYNITVEAIHGTVSSQKFASITETTLDLTDKVQTGAEYWKPSHWGFTNSYGSVGTIQAMPGTNGPTVKKRGNYKYETEVPLIEEYQNSAKHITSSDAAATVTVLMQRVTGLEPGVYQVTVYANACYTGTDAANGIKVDGVTNVACLFANHANYFIPARIKSKVTEHGEYTLMAYVGDDGILEVGMFLAKNGTNWHSMQIKSIDNLSLWSEDVTASTGVNIAQYNDNHHLTETSPRNGVTNAVWQRAASNPGTNPWSNFGEVPALDGDGGVASVYRSDGTSVDIVERYAEQQPNAGRMIWQEVNGMEPGSYTITMFASSCYTGDRNASYGAGTADNLGQSTVQDGDLDYTYIYANDTKRYIPSYRASKVSTYEEVTLTTEVGEDGKLEFGLYLAKTGTNWHCIQVKSLYHNVGKQVAIADEYFKMTATPDDSYRFAGWTLDGAEAGNGDRTLEFRVTNDHYVVANFAPDSRDPNIWVGEPLDWVYGLQTSATTLGNYTFKSSASYDDNFEKDTEGNVVADSKGREYNHRFSILGESNVGGRYLLVEPTESGTLELVVRNPNSTSAKIYFYDGKTEFTTISGTGTAITNSEGDYQILTHNFTYGTNKSFVVEADAPVQIYALRYEGQAIAILPTDGEIPEGYAMTNATVNNVTDVNSTMYGSSVVVVANGKTSTITVPHYVRVDKVKLRGTTATETPGNVSVNTASMQFKANGGTEVSELESSISNPAYGKTFTIGTSANGFMGIVTLYGKVHKHYSEPTFSYNYKTNELTMASAESGTIYYTTNEGMTADNATSFGEVYSSAIDLSEKAASATEFDSVTYYAVVPSSVANWQNNDNAFAPSVVASFTVYFYPKTMEYCTVETGDGNNLRDAITYANAASSEANPVTIFIPWGTYDLGEKAIEVGNWVSLIGASNEHTFIKSKNSRQTLLVKGSNNYLQDLQIVNESEGGSAIIDKGTNNIYRKDSLISAQKTYYSDGGWKQRNYFDSCGFQGKIDVVGGTGDIWFEHCYFNLGADGQHLSAQRTDIQTQYGYVFNGCRVSGENNYSIARPAAEYPKAVWQNSVFGGLMLGTGFGPGRGNLELTYHEYNCKDENGLDVTYHTTEACDPANDAWVYSDAFKGYDVETVFDRYTKGSVTLAKWTRRASDVAQRTVHGASWNGSALAFAAEDAPVYLLECYLKTEADGNTPDLHYRFLNSKVLYIYNDVSQYDSVHVRAANVRGAFGVPARVRINEGSTNKLVTEITLNANGYATYSNEQQVRVVGACACKAYFDEANKLVTLAQVENGMDVVPANTGVILFGNANATVQIYQSIDDVEGSEFWPENTHNLRPNARERRTYYHGELIGEESGEKEAFESIYVLSGGNFKKASDMTAIGKNKAFFGFTSDKGAASYRIVFADEEVIGIDNLHESDTIDMIYDLPGRKIDEQKGLIIKNGRVILNK